jgi:hypothetical protein
VFQAPHLEALHAQARVLPGREHLEEKVYAEQHCTRADEKNQRGCRANLRQAQEHGGSASSQLALGA